MKGNDYLNFIISAFISLFALLIGGGWFSGLLTETENPEIFLLLVSFGLLMGGIGLALNCFYLLTGKVYRWSYYASLILLIGGLILALIGQAIYRQ